MIFVSYFSPPTRFIGLSESSESKEEQAAIGRVRLATAASSANRRSVAPRPRRDECRTESGADDMRCDSSRVRRSGNCGRAPALAQDAARCYGWIRGISVAAELQPKGESPFPPPSKAEAERGAYSGAKLGE